MAEALWRGEPLSEFYRAWATSARARLIEDYRSVREESISLELDRDSTRTSSANCTSSRRRLRSRRRCGSLMLALYRCGRHDEALELFTAHVPPHGRAAGYRPGVELQELNRQILEQDPHLCPGRKSAVPPEVRPAATEPRRRRRATGSLPRDTGDFTGRTRELAVLLAEPVEPAADLEGGASAAPPVVVVYGMPGIGKTATTVGGLPDAGAVPDGEFYVDLRGYSEQSQRDPGDALAWPLGSSGATIEKPDPSTNGRRGGASGQRGTAPSSFWTTHGRRIR